MAKTKVVYVPWFVNEWLADTAMLSPLGYAFYNRALMQYYLRGKALSDSEIDRLILWVTDGDRSIIERSSNDYRTIIEDHFAKQDDGLWHNARADEELAKIQEKSLKAQKSVEAREKKREKPEPRSSNEDRTIIERSSNDDQTMIERSSIKEPITNNHITPSTEGVCSADKPRPAPRRKPAAGLNFYDLPDALVADWIRSRGSKKLTQTAIDGFKREADAAGWTLERAVRFSIENGYQGFRHNWESVRNVGSTSSVTKAELDRSAAWSAYIKPYVAKCMRPPLTYEQWTEQYEREHGHGSGMSAEEEYELQGGRS